MYRFTMALGLVAGLACSAASADPGTGVPVTPMTFPQAPPAPSSPPPQTTSATDPDAMVCKAGEPIIGSRIPGPRQCRTQREWDQERVAAQKALYGSQMKGMQSRPPGN